VITSVSAHLVNGEPVALVQEAGRKDWWTHDAPLPANIDLFTRFEDVDHKQYKAVLWITNREAPESLWREQWDNLIIYRPPAEQDEGKSA